MLGSTMQECLLPHYGLGLCPAHLGSHRGQVPALYLYKVYKKHLTKQEKAGIATQLAFPALETEGRGSPIQSQLGYIVRPFLKNRKKLGWEDRSVSKMFPLQAWDLSSVPQNPPGEIAQWVTALAVLA